MFEVVVAWLIDEKGMRRGRAVLLNDPVAADYLRRCAAKCL